MNAGFAVVDTNGKVAVESVADTEIGAKCRWMAVQWALDFSVVLTIARMTDDEIGTAFDALAELNGVTCVHINVVITQ